MTRGPILILGSPRSGTTLVRLLLNAHSEVCAPDELIFFGKAVFPAGARRWGRGEVPQATLANFVSHLTARLPAVSEEEVWNAIHALPRRDPRGVFVAVMEMLAANAGKPRWAEKTPGNVFYADVLAEMFPDAKFIFVRRDPRAVVASMSRVHWYPADSVLNAMNHKHYLNAMVRAKRTLPAGSCKELRYESLLAAPEQELAELCDFLEMPFERSMLEFHQESAVAMDPRAAQDFNRRATGPLDPANAARWRHTMSADEQALVERMLLRELIEFGYRLDAPGRPAFPQRLTLHCKSLYWRINRLRHLSDRAFQQNDVVLYRQRRRFARLLGRLGFNVSEPHRRGPACQRVESQSGPASPDIEFASIK